VAYDWGAGKSVRAVAAEAEGLFPATRMSTYLRKRFPRRFRGLTVSDIKAIVPPSEWHHVGKKYNRVDYYSLTNVFEYRHYLRRRIAVRRENSRLWKMLQNGEGAVDLHKPEAPGEYWHTLEKKYTDLSDAVLCKLLAAELALRSASSDSVGGWLCRITGYNRPL